MGMVVLMFMLVLSLALLCGSLAFSQGQSQHLATRPLKFVASLKYYRSLSLHPRPFS